MLTFKCVSRLCFECVLSFTQRKKSTEGSVRICDDMLPCTQRNEFVFLLNEDNIYAALVEQRNYTKFVTVRRNVEESCHSDHGGAVLTLD
jgi:hypothetical protein